MKAFLFALLTAFLIFTPNAVAAEGETGLFDLKFESELFSDDPEQAFSGDVFVAFSEEGEPRRAMHAWFNAPPVMRFRVEGVLRGQVVRLGLAKAVAWHPAGLAEQGAKKWRVQASARRSLVGREAGLANGDVFSIETEVNYLAGSDRVLELVLDQQAKERVFEETERMRLFEFESPALSAFHGFPYTMKAGVLLPENYDPEKKYPVLYSVTGFGGTHHEIRGFMRGGIRPDSPLHQCIVVVPDANARYGHTVFCDSATNGPWGQALVFGMMPALEKKYGGVGPEQRFVTGVSSGGWSSLWLQVTYPDQFSGCWSHVPDPIDFHDFQQINLYDPVDENTPRNMFIDEAGEVRPLARRGGQVMLTYQDFAEREHVLNPGGQLRSFEGCFSPRLADGTPRRVFDVETGQIDHEATQHWRKYDISHTLLTQWDKLRPALKGKIHIYAGEVDTFYLEGAVQRFHGLAKQQGLLQDMVVEVIPGMPHTLHRDGWIAMEETIQTYLAAPLAK